MNEALMETAYKTARENYKAAGIATFQALDARFAAAGFDTVHHAAQRRCVFTSPRWISRRGFGRGRSLMTKPKRF
jgi:hypothetical protein